MNERVGALIAELGLAAHPEGGWYRETFRSTLAVRRDADGAPRAALTTIHFLLAAGQVSRWHRVGSDEAWHHHEGGPLELLTFAPDGTGATRIRLGAGTGRYAHVVPAHWWQAAQPLGDYALVGCTVGPGFDFADFSMLDGQASEQWPPRPDLGDFERFI